MVQQRRVGSKIADSSRYMNEVKCTDAGSHAVAGSARRSDEGVLCYTSNVVRTVVSNSQYTRNLDVSRRPHWDGTPIEDEGCLEGSDNFLHTVSGSFSCGYVSRICIDTFQNRV
uniref:Polyketide synthase n=1 Tax=Peronospora matthiolae TaxID=2874970 RepID=A0AAV1UEW0_9STRA